MVSSSHSPESGPGLARAHELLKERFGHPRFLPGQERAMASILAGRSLLVVMPTGSGKSLLYQLPALLGEGLTLVVSPLIALMKDQVDELRRKNIPATFVNSSLELTEQRARLNSCLQGEYKLLYVAPERFRNQAFLSMLSRVKVARLAVDEAHCISEWGHDFRPDYLRLKKFREQMGRPLTTALTATATRRVQKDIVEYLGLADDEVDIHVHGFDRPNLKLRVVEARSEDEKIAFLLNYLRRNKGAGIIYAGTRRSAEDLAAALKQVESRVGVYHAGLEPEERSAAQEAFLSGRDRVVVATNAFGMGIDKPDVRFVFHYNYPGSVEQYYQEIGRAGRDGLDSDCVLLYSPADHFLREYFIDLNYPPAELVAAVYEALWRIPENPIMMTYKEIAEQSEEKIKDGQVGAAVRLLDEAGMTRALTGEPRIAVTLIRPGAEVLASVRGPQQKRVLEALAGSFDLEEPGRYELSLSEVGDAAGLGEDQVRRALLALDHEGVISYEPAFRGRGIEKLFNPPPPFAKVPIDWAHYNRRRSAEEEKLAAMEEYIARPSCRREYILRYFGEEGDRHCGTCDNCEEAKPKKTKRAKSAEAGPQMEQALLVCVRHLRFPLGKGKIASVVTGSREKDLLSWGLDRNPAYGKVRAPKDQVKAAIDHLILRGYLKSAGEHERPVIELTESGREAAREVKLEELGFTYPGPKPEGRPEATGRSAAVGARESSAEEIRSAALACVAGLASPVGVTKVAAVLAGSRAAWIADSGADRLPVYGAISATQEKIRETLGAMLEEGLLRKGGNDRYPVILLTTVGKSELERQSSRLPEAEAPGRSFENEAEPEPEPAFSSDSLGPSQLLDDLLRQLLMVEPDQAKAMLTELRLFNPSVIAERLQALFASAQTSRARARAVWAAGELGGEYGLSFLVQCSSSEDANLRRLAASALGKVAESVRGETGNFNSAFGSARQTLTKLLEDPAPQVRESAGKALAQFSGGPAERP